MLVSGRAGGQIAVPAGGSKMLQEVNTSRTGGNEFQRPELRTVLTYDLCQTALKISVIKQLLRMIYPQEGRD